MKIGIYAGTFDPIHKGHLEFAKNALEQAGLDKVVIIAEKTPYRKKPYASWDHRQAMIERATEDIENADHDYEFANELAHQHTMVDMISVTSRHFGADNEIWFLVGSDIFEYISRWKNIIDKENYGGFVVAIKGNYSEEWLSDKVGLLNNIGLKFNIINISHESIVASSSRVREAIGSNQVAPDIDEKVAEYIRIHGLYSSVSK